MLVPKLFRMLFFRKSNVTTVFDAIRDATSIYVEVTTSNTNERWKNNMILNNTNIDQFVANEDKTLNYILYGRNRDQVIKFQDRLEEAGFKNIHNVGNLKDLKEIEEQNT